MAYGILAKIDLPRPVIIGTKVKSYVKSSSKRYIQYKLIVSLPNIVKDYKFIIIPVTDEELKSIVKSVDLPSFRRLILGMNIGTAVADGGES